MRHAKPRRRRRRGRIVLAMASALSIAAAVLHAGSIVDIEKVGLALVAEVEAIGAGGRARPPQESGSPEEPEAGSSNTTSARESRRPEPTRAPAEPPSPPTADAAPATVRPDQDEPADRDAARGRPLPEDSGQGKRIVYALKDNHVWLVAANGEVVRDYPVSGTRFGQVEPGTYEVLRKRRHTISYHGTESMEYMVTFTEGVNAAIGFHDIPVDLDTGKPIQTLDQLGQSLSDGCVRQAEPDARALWNFAPVGTKVIVLP